MLEEARVVDNHSYRKNVSEFLGGKKHYPKFIQKVFHGVGKAIDQFQMMEDGDRILVGVSGVDSITLLWLLRERLTWIPVKYTLKAIYIDPGFDETTGKIIGDYLRKESFDYEIIKTDIGMKAHEPHAQENPCFLCSRERKKRLFLLAREGNYQKIALGHHLDDINATLFINILYGGSISTMLPRQDLFGGRLTIIRPLTLVGKEQIQKLAEFLNIPPIVNPCPSSQVSQRKQINEFLDYFYSKDQRIRYNIFHAMSNIHRDYLL
jgi:tRNA 2-thiocytidine biosynthesis protein TtcA